MSQEPESEECLEELLSRPSNADIEFLRRLKGDVLVLGAGGKMGPSLCVRIRRASDQAGTVRRVVAVSRFSGSNIESRLQDAGVEILRRDLLDPDSLLSVPDCENVYFLAGRKFGSTERLDLTWAMNAWVPAVVASRYREARVLVYSTGNVYPFVPAGSLGSVETDAPAPVGEYAQSCLGRERLFEYFSHAYGTQCLFFRLNYAVDLRYGVLVDLATKVWNGTAISLSVPRFNVIWQGDANSYALRALGHCSSPPSVLNVTGRETVLVRDAAEWFGRRFGREVAFSGSEGTLSLLSDASACHRLLGPPDTTLPTLMEWVAHWIECGGRTLGKPTKFEATDGRF